jgi:hypothetical protein
MIKTKTHTRIALGRSGVLRLETKDTQLLNILASGVSANFSEDGGGFMLTEDTRSHVSKGRKRRFHRMPNGVHHVSVPLTQSDVSRAPQFRITPVDVFKITDDDEIIIPMPSRLKAPKGSIGYTREPGLTREPNPLSVEAIEKLREQVIKTTDQPSFDPVLFSQLLELVKEYAFNHDIRVCVDEVGELYGRIG